MLPYPGPLLLYPGPLLLYPGSTFYLESASITMSSLVPMVLPGTDMVKVNVLIWMYSNNIAKEHSSVGVG